MNGIHGEDMPMIYKHLKEKYPEKFKSEYSVKKWLSKNRITPHHFSGDTIQLVPMQLHGNVKHTGEAYNLRNANGHSH
ncbi:hypothetical protein [Myroides odoratimimus]|uniref:hypothetical protein n=1 Tax=Myroides odoratimimus TaxID=76832 RepID=UPI0031018341